jgi:hypothetical protein
MSYMYCSLLFIEDKNLNLLFFLNKNYNIICSKKLHTDRIQHSRYHHIFFGIFEVFKYNLLEFQISMELELRTSAFIKGNSIPSLNTLVLMNSLLCITPMRLLHFTWANVGSKIKKKNLRGHTLSLLTEYCGGVKISSS